MACSLSNPLFLSSSRGAHLLYRALEVLDSLSSLIDTLSNRLS